MPIIQITFDNPLNTSVQVGDNAYFSNPTPVSSVGNPLGGSWTSTTTPHMTNDIDGVVDLGEILTITPWDGINSFITCNMDQALFNKYYASVVVGGCIDDTSSPPATNSCDKFKIYETYEEILNFAFTPGNYNTPYQNIGVSGTSTLTGNSVWDTKDTCDGVRIIFPFYNPQEAASGHTGGSSAAETLNHWINNHGVNTLSATSTYAEFLAVIQGGQQFGHTGTTYAPCRCSYNQNCTTGSYIMFSKDNKANMSSILGYYASVEYRNSSQIKSELFNVGTDFFESSK